MLNIVFDDNFSSDELKWFAEGQFIDEDGHFDENKAISFIDQYVPEEDAVIDCE